MPEHVISDASVLIVLDKIGQLELLESIYSEIYTTPEIVDEFGGSRPDWIKILPATDQKYQFLLQTRVDPGEASVIALAKEKEDALLILDDLKARKLAKQLKIPFTGTS
jgi:predicted nucleic acid-binding protein